MIVNLGIAYDEDDDDEDDNDDADDDDTYCRWEAAKLSGENFLASKP